MIGFEAPPPRHAVLWSVGVDADIVPVASGCDSRVVAQSWSSMPPDNAPGSTVGVCLPTMGLPV